MCVSIAFNSDLVGNILLEIINKSLETGIFPDNWKESMVTSIEKILINVKNFVQSSSWKIIWKKTSYCQNNSLVSEGNFHVKHLLIMS